MSANERGASRAGLGRAQRGAMGCVAVAVVAAMAVGPAQAQVDRLDVRGVQFDGRDAEGLWLTHATIGYDLDAGRLLATLPRYPANRADDASRPGFAGALWSSRAVMGGETQWNAYPYATDAAAYGAYGAEDAVALVRVGPYVVPVDPWTPIAIDGPRQTREVRERLERGRQEWLRERGFVGAVRTFVNDAAVTGRDGKGAPLAKFAGVSRPGSDGVDASTGVTAPEEKKETKEGAELGGAMGPDAKAGAKADVGADAKVGAVIRVRAKPITRISMPHAAGLANSGTRVIGNSKEGPKAADERVADERVADEPVADEPVDEGSED